MACLSCVNVGDAKNSTKLVVLLTVGMKDIVVSEFFCKTQHIIIILLYLLKKTEKNRIVLKGHKPLKP